MNFDSKIVVIDNGTGYTKMGYTGNPQPQFDIPTLIAETGKKTQSGKYESSDSKICNNLDFCIGNQANNLSRSQYDVINPMKDGIIHEWGLMEKFWHRSIFDYLRCDPSETVFVLTQPPFNPPENRENMAQIMFQTFNVNGLYIGVQAVLALVASSGIVSNISYTGTVLDSGDGVTHIIPVVDGFVINSCVKHLPLAGKKITNFIEGMIRDRNEKCPTEQIFKIAKKIKQKYGYIVEDGNLIKQFMSFDRRMKDPHLKQKFNHYIEGVDPNNKFAYRIEVGPQRFLAPEMFFNPQIIDQQYKRPIDQIIDNVIQSCPIYSRRALYKNIALSGGSTLFKGLKQRLQNGINKRVKHRLQRYEIQSKTKTTPIDVQVLDNPFKRYAVWIGGSLIASKNNFSSAWHTRKQYFERGPSICRYNSIFVKR